MDSYDVQESHDQLDGFPAPSQAERVYGHDNQAAFLAQAYASGKMHHAFLFDGPAGIGKASLAFLFARHLVAHPDHSSAPMVLDGLSSGSSTRQIAMGAHPQVMHLTRPLDAKTGKHKTQLTVDETRKIGHFLSHTVPGNGYRVVIVDPVNDMNANAANALLKNLEEPTPRTVFILIAHSSGRLLPTIRSRCLSVRFQPLHREELREVLVQMGLESIPDTLIERANGSPRAAIMLLNSGGLDVIDAAEKILSAPLFDASAALKLGEVVSARDAEPVYGLLCEHLLDLVARLASNMGTTDLAAGKKLATLHQSIAQTLKQTNMYNLDKRQMVVDLLHQIHKATASG